MKQDFIRNAAEVLEDIHISLLNRAKAFRDENMSYCDDPDAFETHWQDDSPGWLCTPWTGSSEQEEELSKRHKITIRCLPSEDFPLPGGIAKSGTCFLTGTANAPSRSGAGATEQREGSAGVPPAGDSLMRAGLPRSLR